MQKYYKTFIDLRPTPAICPLQAAEGIPPKGFVHK
jgi:hypothetical protein